MTGEAQQPDLFSPSSPTAAEASQLGLEELAAAVTRGGLGGGE